MSDYEKMNQALRQEISAITPNRVEDLLARLDEPRTAVSETVPTRRPRRMYRQLIAAVLALVLLGGGVFYGLKSAQRSVVILDADAPVAFTVDGFNRVRSVRLEDARAVSAVDAKRCTGKQLDDAVTDVTEQLIAGDLISTDNNAVLLSVQEDSGRRADALTKTANHALTETAAKHQITPAVVMQTVSEDASAARGTSLGKAALVEKLSAGMDQPETDALYDASVHDLLYYADAKEVPLADVTVHGTRNDDVYYTADQAVSTVRDADGLAEAAASAELDWQDAELVYVVTVQTDADDVHYLVSARTGEILSCDAVASDPSVPEIPGMPEGGLPPIPGAPGLDPNLPPISDLPTVPDTPAGDSDFGFGTFKNIVDFWDDII